MQQRSPSHTIRYGSELEKKFLGISSLLVFKTYVKGGKESNISIPFLQSHTAGVNNCSP